MLAWCPLCTGNEAQIEIVVKVLLKGDVGCESLSAFCHSPPRCCVLRLCLSLLLSICGLALSPRLDLVHPHVTRANEHKTVETEAAAAFCQAGLPLSFAADALRCVPRSHTRQKTQNFQNGIKRPHTVRHTLLLCSGRNLYSCLWTRVG